MSPASSGAFAGCPGAPRVPGSGAKPGTTPPLDEGTAAGEAGTVGGRGAAGDTGTVVVVVTVVDVADPEPPVPPEHVHPPPVCVELLDEDEVDEEADDEADVDDDVEAEDEEADDEVVSARAGLAAPHTLLPPMSSSAQIVQARRASTPARGCREVEEVTASIPTGVGASVHGRSVSGAPSLR